MFHKDCSVKLNPSTFARSHLSTDTTNPLCFLDVLQKEDVLRLDRRRQVYCNRDLKLETIDAIGFDMDYTLAMYVQEELDALSVNLTLQRLVEHRGYDAGIVHCCGVG